MSPNPNDVCECPFCNGEITGSMVLADRVNPNEKFECPVCGITLVYSLIKQPTGDKMLMHLRDKRSEDNDAKVVPFVKADRPIRKLREKVTLRAYLKKQMRSRAGVVLPELTPVIILNAHMSGDTTDIVPEDITVDKKSLPFKVPKEALLLAGEEVDHDLAFRLCGVDPASSVSEIITLPLEEDLTTEEETVNP